MTIKKEKPNISRVCPKCNSVLLLKTPPYANSVIFECKSKEHKHRVVFSRNVRCKDCENGRLELIAEGNAEGKNPQTDYFYRCDLCLTLRIYEAPLDDDF